MACGLVVLVSLLALTSAVRPEATNPDVSDRRRREHGNAERFASSVATATEAVSAQVKRSSAQALSEDEIAEISSYSASSSASEANAPEVTNSVRRQQNEMRSEGNATNERERRGEADAPTDKHGVLTNRGEINKDPIDKDDDNESRERDKEPDACRKTLTKNVDLDSPLTETTGNDVIVRDSDAISRTRRDLSKLKRILEDASRETSEDQEQPDEDFLPDDDDGQEEGGEDRDEDPQSDEATPGEAFRRRDFSKRPRYYPDWGPKRTWRINMMRVWGKRSVGGGRVKYWNRK